MKPEQAHDRRRELNRLAAQKLRNRQKERAINIRQEYFNAQSNNTRLVYERKQLFKEKEMLRMKLEGHLQFCHQQTSNLIIRNPVFCLASPTTAFSHPIFITNVEQTTDGKVSFASSDCDSRNEVEEVGISQELFNDTVENTDKLQATDDEAKSEEPEAEGNPLTTVEDITVDVKSSDLPKTPPILKSTVSNEMFSKNEETNKDVSKSHACIPLMVLNMNELSEI